MKKIILTGAIVTLLIISTAVFAASNTQFSQTINAGVLSTDILDASQQPVASPSVNMSAISTSTSCQTPGSSGTYGTNTQRIYVDNPGAANNGWALSLAATSGPTAVWDTGSLKYDFNDPTGSGCTDGGDADTYGGQMTVNPSVGTVTPQSPSTSTGISVGSSSAFNQGTTDSIGLVTAGSTSDDIWRGYLTGVNVTQTIPASQPAGTYTINLTQTVVAS